MPSFGTVLKPVSIVAFLLSCLSCLLAIIAISIISWWSEYINGYRRYHGVWNLQNCLESNNCASGSATTLEGGQEELFVSKIFATFTALFLVIAVILHIIYAVVRMSVIRTSSIFMLGSAALFGLLSIFVFLGFYGNTDPVTNPSIGAAFYIFLLATILSIAAAGFTIWASVRKAHDFQVPQE
uniref:MARVEL domain-containing protein n=1 Tax=Arion vulgaris TaxID=1028688 RepID=A0A0B7A2F5_9EUPU